MTAMAMAVGRRTTIVRVGVGSGAVQIGGSGHYRWILKSALLRGSRMGERVGDILSFARKKRSF